MANNTGSDNMSVGKKIDNLLGIIINTIDEELNSELAFNNFYECFENNKTIAMGIGSIIYEYDFRNREIRNLILNVAAISDILLTLKTCILADSDVDDSELDIASKILGPSFYRMSQLPNYKKLGPIEDGQDALKVIQFWEKDSFILGGNFIEGAVISPLRSIAILVSIASRSEECFNIYRKATESILKIMFKNPNESEMKHRDNIINILKSGSNVVKVNIECYIDNQTKNNTQSESIKIVNEQTENPEEILKVATKELDDLIGLPEVKSEVARLVNFLKIQEQRKKAGLKVPDQSLHFVFTGNPGTGKTTVARIISKILFGFGILKRNNLVEADRSSLVAGFVGQTAIKTTEVIEKAMDGVLFIDEAYTLTGKGANDYGQESVDTILKKMEDLRGRLIIIAAGYPKQMQEFLGMNPGLESRFTRFINFEDYHVSDMCRIFERFAESNQYKLTQDFRGNISIFFNKSYLQRNEKFGNARFVRNVYEKTLGNHSDRLSMSELQLSKEDLITLDSKDIPFDLIPFAEQKILGLERENVAVKDLTNSRWKAQCPGCNKISLGDLRFLGKKVSCKCGAKFIFSWWNLDPKTVNNLGQFKIFERPADLIGITAK